MLAGLHSCWELLLHTVAVVFEQERPAARVNGRRDRFGLDDIGVGVGLYERHCSGCRGL